MAVSQAPFPLDRPALPDWQTILDPGEVLLWQDRPDPGLAIGLGHVLRLLRSAVMLGLFLYLVGRSPYGIADHWDVKLIVVFIFFLPVPLDLIVSMVMRRLQTYGLTAHRAITITNLGPFGQRIRSWPLTAATPLTLLRGRRWSSLIFTTQPKWYSGLVTPEAVTGFARIARGDSVYALMRQAQKEVS